MKNQHPLPLLQSMETWPVYKHICENWVSQESRIQKECNESCICQTVPRLAASADSQAFVLERLEQSLREHLNHIFKWGERRKTSMNINITINTTSYICWHLLESGGGDNMNQINRRWNAIWICVHAIYLFIQRYDRRTIGTFIETTQGDHRKNMYTAKKELMKSWSQANKHVI